MFCFCRHFRMMCDNLHTELHGSNPHTPNLFLKSPFSFSETHLREDLPSGLDPSGFHTIIVCFSQTFDAYYMPLSFRPITFYHLYFCTPEDDPGRESKHVVLLPTANKTNVDTAMSICLFQNYCCVDFPIIYLSTLCKFFILQLLYFL
jgi:hypothetical protein